MTIFFRRLGAWLVPVLLLILCGYITNIAKLVNGLPSGLSALEALDILRFVGAVFPPLGVVMGFV
jgi:predicted benzoate:H+ symporter BenE